MRSGTAAPTPHPRELPLGAPFEIPADPLPPGLLPGGDDVIDLRQAALRILQRHYAGRGWAVLQGADFEENLLHAEHDTVPRREWDEYARIKLGKSPFSHRARRYSAEVLRHAPPGAVENLLAACRLCTYAGGPGFPDMVLLGDGLRLRALAVGERAPSDGRGRGAPEMGPWTREQKLFAFIATLSGLEIRAAGPGAPVRFVPAELLDAVLADPRARAMRDGLEAALARERERLPKAAPEEARRAQDEIEALEVERFRSPFPLLRRWREEGVARWRDVEAHRDLLRASHRARLARFASVESTLRGDPRFPRWTGNPAPEALADLAGLLGTRFGLGETRAKAFLLYLKDSASTP
ncbi:MAG: hypothetical protein QXT68_04050 [Halobacteria archaeon]